MGNLVLSMPQESSVYLQLGLRKIAILFNHNFQAKQNSSDYGILLTLHCGKHTALVLLHRWVYLDLTHVGVPAILMVAHHSYLNHVGAYWLVMDILDGYFHPPGRFIHIHHFYFLEVVKISSGSYRYPEKGHRNIKMILRVYLILLPPFDNEVLLNCLTNAVKR